MATQYAAPTSSERFKHPSLLQQSPSAPQSGGRAGSDAQHVYGFPQSQYSQLPAMPATVLQYGQGMEAQNAPRQQPQQQSQPQQQQYQSYGGNNYMYGMAPPQAQTPSTQTAYEHMPQYRQRPGAASETMPAGFGVPQTAQYYLAGQAGPTSAPTSDLTGQHLPSQYQQTTYAQPGPSASQSYPSTMMDPSQSGAYASYAQQSNYTTQTSAQNVDQAFNEYQARIRSIFTMAREGTLRDIGTHLLQISQYLTGNAEALGAFHTPAI